MKRGMMGRRFEEEIMLVRLIKGLASLKRSRSPMQQPAHTGWPAPRALPSTVL
jgi:hypothetical protein